MRILAAIQGLAHGDVSDLDLLSRFVQTGDHAAFELLVWRHRRLVYGVCRRVVGNSHDAEDASQATFLLLARQASTIHGANVAGWLARVAYHCAVRVRKRKSGQQSANLAEVPAPEPFLPEPDLSKILDAEVNRLPEKYRLAIVLCYLDGKTYNQVAAELNCPVGTLCGWLTRAKVMLRRRLARRGVTLSIGGLAAYLDGLSSSAAVANETVRSITMAAVAYRVWETFPSPATTIANGVLRMMTWKLKVLPAALLGAIVLFFGLNAAAISRSDLPKVDDPPKTAVAATKHDVKKTDAELLQGVWVFDAATRGKGGVILFVWSSRLSIIGDAIRVDGFLDANLKVPLKGTIHLDQDTEPKRFDLTLEELDLTQIGDPTKIAAGTYRGIYRWEGDRMSVCFAANPGESRPESFAVASEKFFRATLVKAPASFTEFPKEMPIKVLGPEGRPVRGAIVSASMFHCLFPVTTGPDGKVIETANLTQEQQKAQERLRKVPEGSIDDENGGWRYYSAKRTDRDGLVCVQYQDFRPGSMVVRDSTEKLMGVVSVSPSAVLGGSMTVQLKPECRVLATTTCQGELETEKRPSGGPLGKYLALIKTPDNRAIAAYYSLDGRLEFSLPPGEYVIQVYGPEGFGSNSLKFTVPENQSEYTLPDPIELPPTAFRDLIGKPAPELSGIVAWKGSPTKLADQKGKFVLLHFWGYWCGQCVQEMPGLMELHEKFKDQDVAIVAVHLDLDGEVDSIKAFDDKMAVYKKDLWNGKDIPFPVALIRGRTSEEKFVGRWSLADTYGIQSYPKTILIDRESKVVREFRFRDAKLAIEQLEELLKDQKKP